MASNFKSWQKENPTKTFKDFKKEIGQKKKKAFNKRNVTSLKKSLFSTFLILCLFAGTFYGKKLGSFAYIFFLKSTSSSEDLLAQEWKNQYFLNKSIVLKAPYFLEEEKTNFKSTTFVNAINNYSYLDGTNFGIVLTHSSYKNDLKKIPLKRASEGRLQEIIQKMNGAELTYNEKEIKINNNTALIKEGKFASQKNEIYFRTFTTYQNKNDLISLMICWVNKNNEYELISNRIIQSLEIR